MSSYDAGYRPRMRFVEALPVEHDGEEYFELRDPGGLAGGVLTVNEFTLVILAMFDGERTLGEICVQFREATGETLDESELARLVDGLRRLHLLAGDDFDAYYRGLVTEYRAGTAREMHSAADLGLDHNAGEVIWGIIQSQPAVKVTGSIVGLVAPHLDYERGGPCYAAAYSTLVNRPPPRRVVILGTNHFGLGAGATVTGKDFSTPLGTTPADREFIARLETRCGDLREFEYDHVREHSVELQLLFCQRLWGADSFRMVAVLCPDPCGDTGTAPWTGVGVDLRVFAESVRDCLADDPDDTLVIAGADLSHVGAFFGEDPELAEPFLADVRKRDAGVLESLAANDAAAWLAGVRSQENSTRICSAGCIYAAMTVLPRARVSVLGYHQAVNQAAQNGVTCAAAVFTQ